MALLWHRLPLALVTLAGDQVASAALVMCAALAPRARKGMGTLASCPPGLGLLQVLGSLGGGSCSLQLEGGGWWPEGLLLPHLGRGRWRGGDAAF